MKSRKFILKVLLSVALIIMVLNLSCTLAAGGRHTVGILPDGTVVATGNNDEGQCDVERWTDIEQVAAGFSHTVALRDNGVVVATGRNIEGQCNTLIPSWTDIGLVVAGDWHTVALKNDGSVVATGKNDEGQCDVSSWRDITQIAAGGAHTVGLEDGGTVEATGRNIEGQCDVGGWRDIEMVVAGYAHTVLLRNDGRVLATGLNDDGQCDVNSWTNIVMVAAGRAHTVGLREDGTVVAAGNNDEGQCDVSGWTDIEWIAAGAYHTVGLKDCGTVVATGRNNDGQCDVGGWILQALSDDPPGTYHLTISSTAGGLVTTPGEGTFAYCESEVVNLVAEADSGYSFVDWTGDVGTIADANDATTTITTDGDYFITANFEEEEPSDGEEPSGGACFIATAAYGTPMAGEIEMLRQFRDEYLMTNPVGQALVDLYYRVSPPIAEFITEHPSLKPIVRAGLLPAVAMSNVAVNTSPVEKMAILGLMVLTSLAIAVWATRWRGRGSQYTSG
jgi:alpha-tubulin suppressor-like RCC1 family protein